MGIGRALAGLGVAITLAASGGSASAAEPLGLEIPPLAGKADVGTRSFQLIDRSRPAGFGQPGKRRLMVQVTYPRHHGRACGNAPYMPPRTAARLLGDLAVSETPVIDTATCVGGPVHKRKMPLILFSHAYTASRGVYTSLVSDLASRGFVVASVDHTSEAFMVEFPGGDVVEGAFGGPLSSKAISEKELVSLVNVRTRDIRFFTTWLLRQNRGKRSWLSGRIDPGRIGIFGHSLGGATAARVSLVDRRFRAAADVDGSLFGQWPLRARTRKPFLLYVSQDGLGSVLPRDKSCRFLGRARGPKFAWQLTGSKHLTFSDFQSLAPQIAEGDPDWPYAALYPAIIGNLDPVASVRAQRNAIARFFRRYVMKPGKRGARPGPPRGVTRASLEQLTCDTSA